jgi:hypothetical protein
MVGVIRNIKCGHRRSGDHSRKRNPLPQLRTTARRSARRTVTLRVPLPPPSRAEFEDFSSDSSNAAVSGIQVVAAENHVVLVAAALKYR